jgi:cobalamin synthase
MRAIAASAWVLALTLGLLSIKQDFRSDASLPKFIAWIRPWEKVYRVPILMPLWGAWAMLVTPQFYRRKSAGDGAVAAFARGCGPLTATAVMGLLLALTITYFNFLPWAQLTISAVTVFAAVAGGTVCCWLDGGLTRRALLAANVITQLVFLLVSLAAWNLLVW